MPLRGKTVISALGEPTFVGELLRCAPALRFAQLALRELSRARVELSAVLEEALAQANANVLAETTPELLPDPGCREVWPRFVATEWLASAASAGDADRIEDDVQRAIQLQIWWFTGKGALAERHIGGRRYLSVPDSGLARYTGQIWVSLVGESNSAGDSARWRELLERHASRVDPQWRDDVVARLQGVPRRVAVLPPRLDAVLDAAGNVVDAQAVPVPDLDEQLLRDWAAY